MTGLEVAVERSARDVTHGTVAADWIARLGTRYAA
jgi:hypothetical protein